MTRRRVAKLGEEVPAKQGRRSPPSGAGGPRRAGEEVPAQRVKRGEEVVAKR